MSKILILTPQLPFPPQQGASLRNFHIIQGLAEQHEITLLSFMEEQQTIAPDIIQPMLDLCDRIETVPVPRRSRIQRLLQLATTRRPDIAYRLHSHAFENRLRQLLRLNRYEIVQIEGLELAEAIEIVNAVSPGSKVVFDDHNAETELQRRAFMTDLPNPRRWPAALYSWFQIGRLRRLETWACDMADWVTVVSEADRRTLQSIWQKPNRGITIIPNCIDYQSYQRPAFGPQKGQPTYDLVFSGKMDYRPNVDAVLWFADAVWPLIRTARPATTWAIVGQKPHARLNRLRRLPGVTLTGWVKHVQPFLFGAAVYVMPLRMGSGTRLKLIEAMAAGRAMVSTTVGAEGYAVQHGRELLVADGEKEFASAVLYLLDKPELRDELGRAARRFAHDYDWRQIIPLFNEVYRQLLQI